MNLVYYGYLSLLVVAILFWISNRPSPNRNFGLELSFVILVFGFIGARLGHVLYEDFNYYSEDWNRVFEIWRGGFVWYGGVLLAAIVGILFIKLRKEKLGIWADFVTLPISIGYALGRLSCLIAQCCYGKSCDLPWAISIDGINRHPTQVYASIGEIILFFLLIQVSALKPRPGFVFCFWLFLHSLTRIFVETLRDDPRGPTIIGLSVSTVVSVCLMFVAGISIIIIHRDEFQILPRRKF